jgi:hypothetical protein
VKYITFGKNKNAWAEGMTQVVELLLSKHEALSSNFSNTVPLQKITKKTPKTKPLSSSSC